MLYLLTTSAMAYAQTWQFGACSSKQFNTRMTAAYRAVCACSLDACRQQCISMLARCSSSLPERTRQTTTFRRVLCDLCSTAWQGNAIRHSHISIIVCGTHCPVYTQVAALCLLFITLALQRCTSCAYLCMCAVLSCGYAVRPV